MTFDEAAQHLHATLQQHIGEPTFDAEEIEAVRELFRADGSPFYNMTIGEFFRDAVGRRCLQLLCNY